MNISPLRIVGKACDAFVRKNSLGVAKAIEKGRSNEAKFAASMLVLSIVSKDIVGGVLYTSQSWNNKKIPEEKRKFVAMVDAMNCLVMVGGQFLASKLIEKKLTPRIIKNNLTGVLYDPNDKKIKLSENPVKPLHESNIDALTKKVFDSKELDKLKKDYNISSEKFDIAELSKAVLKKIGPESTKGKAMVTGLGLIVTTIATTALVKRTLAPLISTPLAGWFKDKYLDDKPGQAKNAEPKSDAKSDKKPKQKPNLDDKLLDHSTSPWNYSNQSGDKATFRKMLIK